MYCNIIERVINQTYCNIIRSQVKSFFCSNNSIEFDTEKDKEVYTVQSMKKFHLFK